MESICLQQVDLTVLFLGPKDEKSYLPAPGLTAPTAEVTETGNKEKYETIKKYQGQEEDPAAHRYVYCQVTGFTSSQPVRKFYVGRKLNTRSVAQLELCCSKLR